MLWWMRYQIFAPILLLQFLNLFWYFFILRIGARYASAFLTLRFYTHQILLSKYRAILGQNATDDRSDDEDDGNDEDEEKEE